MNNHLHKINILNSYDVVIGIDLIKQINTLFNFSKYSKVIVITDSNLEPIYFDKVKSSLKIEVEKIVLTPGEKNKNIESVQIIWKKLLDLGCDRKSLVINLGGGVIGDIGGFAASTYMRGIDFLQIPTTLLAQVDASIGGKVGINFNGVKNLIGAFNQPVGVFCDVTFLKSLPKRELIEGFGEVIKHGIISDKNYFNFIISKKPEKFEIEELVEIVKGSCEIKKQIIEEDETEQNSRRLVNFGHTIGHALESVSLEDNNLLLHGEAISIGMVAEAYVSVLKGLLKMSDLEMIIQALEFLGLPTKFTNFDQTEVLKKIKSDKKSEKGIVYFTLISEIGKSMSGHKVTDEELIKALQFIKK